MNIDEIERAHERDKESSGLEFFYVSDIERILDRESALIAKVRELEKDKAGLVVERDALWCLLDDIDTAEDIFKPMINNHFRYVNKKHRKRFNVCDMTDDRHDKAREFLKQHGGEHE